MRNPTDQVVPDDLIKATQSLFRVLDGWTITCIEESDELHTPETFYINGQCCLDTDYKEAAIYPCPGDVDLREYVCTKSCMSRSPLPTTATVKKPSSETFAPSFNMHPIEFPEQNAVLAKDQPEYLPLPVCRHGDRTISCWKLTFGERSQVAVHRPPVALGPELRRPLATTTANGREPLRANSRRPAP